MCGAARKRRRLHPRRVELLDNAHPFIGHTSDLLDRSLKTPELVLQVFNRWPQPFAPLPAAFRKEEIAGRAANQRAD